MLQVLQISTGFAPQQWTEQAFPLPAAWFDAGALAGAAAPSTALELAFVVGSKADGTGHQLQLHEGGQLILEPREITAASAVAIS